MSTQSPPAPPTFARVGLLLVCPWLVLLVSFVLLWISRELWRAGWRSDWVHTALGFSFYGVSAAAGLGAFALMLVGIWRLCWRTAYRHSWAGWSWPVLAWLNMCGVATVGE